MQRLGLASGGRAGIAPGRGGDVRIAPHQALRYLVGQVVRRRGRRGRGGRKPSRPPRRAHAAISTRPLSVPSKRPRRRATTLAFNCMREKPLGRVQWHAAPSVSSPTVTRDEVHAAVLAFLDQFIERDDLKQPLQHCSPPISMTYAIRHAAGLTWRGRRYEGASPELLSAALQRGAVRFPERWGCVWAAVRAGGLATRY